MYKLEYSIQVEITVFGQKLHKYSFFWWAFLFFLAGLCEIHVLAQDFKNPKEPLNEYLENKLLIYVCITLTKLKW